jgi:acetyltransferase
VARCVRLPAPDTAEFAIVVGDPLQGRGLGSLLARELAAAARAAGIRRFAATMLGDNDAARRLMRTISAHLELERSEGYLREVVVDLAA